MQRKVFYSSIVGIVMFFMLSLLARHYNYASEIWLICTMISGIICVITGVCKENVIVTLFVSLGVFFVLLFGFMTGMYWLCVLGVLLFAGWIMGRKVRFYRWKKKYGQSE